MQVAPAPWGLVVMRIGVPVALPSLKGDLIWPTMLQAGVTLTSFCLLQDVSGVLIVPWAAKCKLVMLPSI